MRQLPVRPTTKAQVSGFKFLQRRLELGLALGDERMLHDPLGRRRKAFQVGVAISVLMCVGASALAWLKPEPDPGDAPIIKAASGQLLVRRGEVLHPVSNLASARLIVGEAAQPVRAGEQALSEAKFGAQVGISDAPGLLNETQVEEAPWSVCTHQSEDIPDSSAPRVPGSVDEVVLGHQALPALGKEQGVLAEAGQSEWIIRSDERFQLPPADTPEGRALRRHMNIDFSTPRWRVPADVLSAIPEVAPLGRWEGEVLRTEQSAWLSLPQGIVPISETQRDILLDLGNPEVQLGRTELTQRADAGVRLDIPKRALEWIDPAQHPICVIARKESGDFHVYVAAAPQQAKITQGAMALSGVSIATHAVSQARALGVHTANGTHVIGESGRRHRISEDHYPFLGLPNPVDIPWVMLRLLPEGSELSPEHAANPLVAEDKS
ncbi:type VII secretion protein EccB [Corynebacterium gerontici]|uniref:ESX-1 secretion system protein eccB1 n=1 Tax=Corynebacterium gerontici TaxID=2079234 RepID=A0A3G6J2C6_9CORY|nr:type VII secretion protein EccB [Corynebacterium gerontici]AZA12056.1 ESX-1 secretion system protein eccB1 [Corynebacterium gerontici]